MIGSFFFANAYKIRLIIIEITKVIIVVVIFIPIQLLNLLKINLSYTLFLPHP